MLALLPHLEQVKLMHSREERANLPGLNATTVGQPASQPADWLECHRGKKTASWLVLQALHMAAFAA